MKRIAYTLLILVLFPCLGSAQITVRDPKTGRTFQIGVARTAQEFQSGNYTRAESRLDKTAIVAINKPATLKVHASFLLKYRYREPSFASRFLLQLEAGGEAAAGRIANTAEGQFEYALQRLRDNPESHFRPSLRVAEGALQMGQSGSGMFITPDGYVLTNAHVVELLPENARLLVVQNVSRQAVIDELQKYADYFGVEKLNKELVNETVAVLMQYMALQVELTGIEPEYALETGRTIQKPDYRLQANLITKGSTIPGKDVAILKANISNAPTVALGKASELEIGEDLYLMGYPGVVDLNETLLQTVMEEPTFGSGSASSWQTTAGGWKALGFDGNAGKGNSGGPVFNQYGEVVGLLTFGSKDIMNPVALKQGFNFVVPSLVFGEFIAKANITPSIGPADQEYRQAIALYQAGEYRAALEKFNTVQSMQADWPYLQGYIDKCSAQVNVHQTGLPEREKGVIGTIKWVYGLLEGSGIRLYTIAIALVLLIGAIVKLFRR